MQAIPVPHPVVMVYGTYLREVVRGREGVSAYVGDVVG